MKNPRSEARPQPAQVEAIERCLHRGDLEGAHARLARLQADFPNFKPLKRLAYEIAWQSDDPMRATLAAWEWCQASPNSAQAFDALVDSSSIEFPYLYLHAADRLIALDEDFDADLPALRAALLSELSEEEGRCVDLSRVFLGCGKVAEAAALVERITHPAAQNNFAQALFGQGKVAQAEAVWASVLEMAPADFFALQHLLTMRLWLGGRAAALPLADRLLALPPQKIDDACGQLDGAILLDLLEHAEAAYLATLNTPWYLEDSEYDRPADEHFHLAGALIAWRQGRHDEAVARLDNISDESGDIAALRSQCIFTRISADTPDWSIGQLSQWWPIAHIIALQPKKFARDSELFERWQVPMPQPDYLVAVALNGGLGARTLAIAALQFQAQAATDAQAAARQALVSLLGLPCGPDSVRGDLHHWLSKNGLLEKGMPVSLLVGGKITEVHPLDITIHTDAMVEETVLSAADHKTYGETLDLIHQGQHAKAQHLMEKLLVRYPDYPRVLTGAATLREANGEAIEQWAPLIRRAAEVAPDYFFARAGLIKLLAKEGKLDEARAQLAPLLELKEMHSSEWRSLILTQIELAKADGDLPALMRLNEMLRDCIERFG
jgi:tetratricopeptide (TPR) repeat protein